VIWATTVPLAGVASFLRIGADKHYVSDVVVGAIVGAASGILVPLVFHGREPPSDTPSSTSSQLSASPSSRRWMLSWGAGW
jgi:membrane-associated phospholipid phosphatase